MRISSNISDSCAVMLVFLFESCLRFPIRGGSVSLGFKLRISCLSSEVESFSSVLKIVFHVESEESDASDPFEEPVEAVE